MERNKLKIPYYKFIENVNPIFSALGASQGLDSLLDYLNSYLQQTTTVSRILCFTVDITAKKILPIVNIYADNSLPLDMIFSNKLDEIFDFDEKYDEKNAHVFLFSTLDTSPAASLFFSLFHFAHKSALGMLLYPTYEFCVYVCVFSDVENAFNSQHADVLAQIRSPLHDAIEKRFFKFNLRSANFPAQSHDVLELLRMCSGLKPILKRLEFFAASDRHILVTGETGVGKELFAEAIYKLSKRNTAPFIKINCGAITESLIDSELFGYERGSFTGAVSTHLGYFEQADGGTLFLDEVGELTPAIQVRLLRVLDSGEIRRVGSTRTIHVNVRVIAATHRDLAKEVRENRFREDLWYRLCVYAIKIPPLRERQEDILTLLKYFLGVKLKTMKITPVPIIESSDLIDLTLYPWYGNVRQLEHVIEHALLEYQASNSQKYLKVAIIDTLSSLDLHLKKEEYQEVHANLSSHTLSLDEVNKEYIEDILKKCSGKISGKNGAAALLGLPVSTLRAKMSKLGIFTK